MTITYLPQGLVTFAVHPHWNHILPGFWCPYLEAAR